jgi:hypothetical protein
MSLTFTSQNYPCEICEDASGKCRQDKQDPDCWQCVTRADAKKGQIVNGYIRWRCIGHSKDRMWATFKPDESGQGYLCQREAGSFSTLIELEQRLEWQRENRRRQGKKDIIVTLKVDPSIRFPCPPKGINRQEESSGHQQTGGEA